MHPIVKLHCGKIAATGFFEEWAAAVGQGLEPAILASYVMEMLRSRDDLERQSYTVFVNFIHTRGWSEVQGEIEGAIDLAQIEAFVQIPPAQGEPFYVKLRTIVIGQVEDYWRQFAASHKKESIEVISEAERTPLTKLEEIVQEMVDKRLMEGLDKAKKEFTAQIIAEIKKYFEGGEGEGWKQPQ